MSKLVEIAARACAKYERYAYFPGEDGHHDELAQAMLDALAAAGYAVVPIEPTEAMLQGGGRAYDYPSTFMGGASKQSLKTIPRIYSAMIAAAGE